MTFEHAAARVREIVGPRVLEPETIALARAHARVLARTVTPRSDPAGPALPAGTVLTPLRIARLARSDVTTVQVTRRPTVAVFTIGETHEAGWPAQAGPRHGDARELLVGLLRADGFEPTAWPTVPPGPRHVEVALRDAGCAFDAIFVCVAAALPLVHAVLETFGTVDAMLPAPTADGGAVFGRLDAACLLALPAGHTPLLGGYLLFGRQMLDGLHGRREARPVWRGRLTAAPGGALFQPVRSGFGADGVLALAPMDADAPIDEADALLVLPGAGRPPAVGEPVEVIPLPLP